MVQNISNTEYEELISKTINVKENKEKSIVDGKVVAIENDMVIVDVGLKVKEEYRLENLLDLVKSLEIEIRGKSCKFLLKM